MIQLHQPNLPPLDFPDLPSAMRYASGRTIYGEIRRGDVVLAHVEPAVVHWRVMRGILRRAFSDERRSIHTGKASLRTLMRAS